MSEWYHDQQLLVAALAQHGSWAAVARETQIPVSTLKSAADKLGVKAERASHERPVFDGTVNPEDVLRHEIKELRTALEQARKTAVRDARVIELLEQAIPGKKPTYKPAKPVRHNSGFTPHAFLLQWSDLHAAERVFLDQMNGVNEYDWEIMLRRHDRIAKAIHSFKDNRPYPVPVLHIVGGGDMATGDIHDELRQTNELVVMESALQLGLDGAEFIEGFVPQFERIEIDWVPCGNHGRLAKKMPAKNAFDNLDWMVGHIIKLRLAQYPSVTVRVGRSAFVPVKVMERWNLLAFHGDGIPTNHPGIPWGGVTRRCRELEHTFEPIVGSIHHFLVHHFHQSNVVDGKRIIINGSVKGPDEYSIKKYGGGAGAEQNLLTFHPTRGLTDVSFLDLQDV